MPDKAETSVICSLSLIKVYEVNLINKPRAIKSIKHIRKYPKRVKEEIIKNVVIRVININTIHAGIIKELFFIKKSINYIK